MLRKGIQQFNYLGKATAKSSHIIQINCYQVTNMVDEYVDPERRYNLPENNPANTDQVLSDTDSFTNLVTSGLRLDGVRVSKIHSLGKKQDNKTQPMFVTLDSF